MTPMQCLCAKSNNRTRGQFECGVTWCGFRFDFVCLDARCGCCSIIFSRFEVTQTKQVGSKITTKNVNNYK